MSLGFRVSVFGPRFLVLGFWASVLSISVFSFSVIGWKDMYRVWGKPYKTFLYVHVRRRIAGTKKKLIVLSSHIPIRLKSFSLKTFVK